jgi:hypothetical protein
VARHGDEVWTASVLTMPDFGIQAALSEKDF